MAKGVKGTLTDALDDERTRQTTACPQHLNTSVDSTEQERCCLLSVWLCLPLLVCLAVLPSPCRLSMSVAT